MSVYGYVRVSTAEQAGEDKNSLEAQRRRILRSAEDNGFKVSRIFSDAGVSGSIPLSKRPKISAGDLGELLVKAEEASSQYVEEKDSNVRVQCEYMEAAKENIFMKGQSRRIWGELHKVVDSSDVLVQVCLSYRPFALGASVPERCAGKQRAVCVGDS